MKKMNKRIVRNKSKQQEEIDEVSAFGDDEGYDIAADQRTNKKTLPSSRHRGLVGWPFRKANRGEAIITLAATAPVRSIAIPATNTNKSNKNNSSPRRRPSTRRRSSHSSHGDSSRRKRSSSKTQHFGGGGPITASEEDEEALNHVHYTILLMREDANSIVDDTREDVLDTAVISIASSEEEKDEYYVYDNDGDNAANTNHQQHRYRCSNETQKGMTTRRSAAVGSAGEIREDLTCGLEGEASLVDWCAAAEQQRQQQRHDAVTSSTTHQQKQYSKSVAAVLSTCLLDPVELSCSMLTGMLVGEGQQKVCLHCLKPVNLFTQKASVRTGYPYNSRRHRDQYLHQQDCEAERTRMEILMNDVLDELEAILYFVLREGK